MNPRTLLLGSVTLAAAGALALTGCSSGGGSSSSSSAAPAPTQASSSAIGGGSAACDTNTMQTLAQQSAQAAGMQLVETKDYDCADGWAIVFAITSQNNIQQTTAFVFEAEGPQWVPQTLDSLCSGGNPNGAPETITSQACALR